MNRLVKVTDTDGVVEAAFVYDRAGFLVKEMNAADYLSADTDEERTGTYYTYDYDGNVCSIRKALRKEENGRVCYSRGQRKNPGRNGIDTTDAKQATSHYSCEDCERKQAFHSVINITEDASDPKNGKKISRRKMEDLW